MPLQILVTDKVSNPDELAQSLRTYFDVERPRFFMRKSIAELPQYIQLLGDSATWLVLGGATAIFLKSYLSKLGELAAEGSVHFFKQLRKSPGAEPVAEIAAILAEQRGRLGDEGSVHIGISLLNSHAGAILVVKSDEVLEIARNLAFFISHVAELEEFMQKEIEEGRKPLGNAIIKLEEDGGLVVEWMDQAMTGKHQKRIPDA